jgi:hypothetical protein
VFALFFLFTIIFNRFYHSRLKEKFREYMKGIYNLPIRKVGVLHQEYYCWHCGARTDYVQKDSCEKCGEQIPKCCICNEIIDINNPVNPKDKPEKTTEDIIQSVVGKVQNQMNGGTGVDMPFVKCPVCNSLAHMDEYLSWLKMHGTCPICKENIDFNQLFGGPI